MKIGFFDSGLGGLHVLRHVIAELPSYDYVFLGDTENVPYGTKSDAEIYSLVRQALEFLFAHECQLVIFACNTASVTALRKIQDEFLPQHFPDRKVLGVIIPTVEEVLSAPAERVAIIGTQRTVASGKYTRELSARDPRLTVLEYATPSLVPLIESDHLDAAKQEVLSLVKTHILPFHPDTLVLGCTHYGLLREHLEETFPQLRILSQDKIIPQKLKMYLEKHPERETLLTRDAGRDFFLSKVTPNYERFVQEYFGDFLLKTIQRD